MYLKSLEILGFKSFPEKTVIDFNKGVTAIVGPNGCGKSNITDAIRWVLGEQSVRTLRGDRMEDVIFSGTQTRKAMSYAEVSITIDNSNGKLPIDYAEIQVTRRLYRSGESEYLLNRIPCRLKDITMFFMDTGLGRDGYSIVGQGKVDSILSNKPEDRRRVFEEASGIVKYKTRKIEAERRLAATEQNMVRVDDILNELSLQIEPLAEQSAKAKTYLKLHDALREKEIGWFLDTIRRAMDQMVDCESAANAIQEQLAAQTAALERLREETRSFAVKSREIDAAIQENHRQTLVLNDEAAHLSGSDRVDRERIEQIRSRLRESGATRESTLQQISTLDRELSERSGKDADLQRSLDTYGTRLATAEQEMKAILVTLGDVEREAEDAKFRLEKIQDSLYDKKEQAGQTRGQVGLIESRMRAVERDVMMAASERDQTALSLEQSDSTLYDLEARFTAAEAEQIAATAALEAARDQAVTAKTALENLKMDLANQKYRIATLQDLERNREGYSGAVKQVMARKSPGVVGTVGDLLQVEEKYETAIEIALGQAIQNIVTDSEDTAAREIAFLKERKLGRATFMPLTTVTGRTLDAQWVTRAGKMTGYEGVAVERVQIDPAYDGVARNLLGRIVLVDTLDHALAMARACAYSFRIITLDGEVLLPGGSITGGYAQNRTTGLLGRAREIDRLQLAVAQTESRIDELTRESGRAENEMLDKGRLHAALGKDLAALGHERVRAESARNSVRAEAERLGARVAMLRAEGVQLEAQREAVLAEAAALEQDAASLESRIQTIRGEIAQGETRNREEQARLDDLRESISGLRLSVQSIVESRHAAEEMRQRIEREKRTLAANIQRGEDEAARGADEIRRLEKNVTERAGRIRAIEDELAAANTAATAFATQREQLEGEQAAHMDRLDQTNAEIGRLQIEFGRTEARKGRIESTLEENRNRLWEEYELTYDNATGWSKEIENPTHVQREIHELKQSMRQLGDVNLSAVDEYARVSERYEFMSHQRGDIEEARGKLQRVISDIDKEMQALFLEHFHIINQNFDVVFSDLFGGGTAEVVLEDEENVLECGIEIRAQPPGKKLQNLMPLSGGERSLTAIALLFAILKLRPTPFCVLDEIESALDDANIYMFTDYVRKYQDESQFILVTHRKGTMEAASTLYGVTMQERGISKVLSMKLGE